MQDQNGLLNIVVALQCEAKPIIQFYKLRKIVNQKLAFSIYVNHVKNIYLIISGVGKVNVATATTYLCCLNNEKKYACYLNIGIAGSSQFAVGEAKLIHKIQDVISGSNYYPFTNIFGKMTKSVLFTHDQPQFVYPGLGLVDMEGSSFFYTAARFITHEQIQLLKIVSDNNLQMQQTLNEEKASALVQQNIESIDSIVIKMLHLSKTEQQINREVETTLFFQRWHFTHAQGLTLQEYIRRWSILNNTDDLFAFCQNETKAKAVLQKIKSKLALFI